MTNTDFIIEFDLLYNNALGTSAPNINTYEKSLFLTQAQEDTIRELYEDRLKDISFEQSEKIRRRLAPLTTHSVVSYNGTFDTSLNTLKISDNSKFFVISDDAWYITYERVNTSAKAIKVIPVTSDEYNILDENPFKEPNSRKAWRLDVNNTIDTDKVVEIVSTETLTNYTYRYITEPSPIVLVDLATDSEYSGMNLTIRDISDETESILPNEVHGLLLDKAVVLATLAYKENTLANNVQLNNNSL